METLDNKILQNFKNPLLIVEDEEAYLEILVEICDTLGIPHKECMTGSQALEMVQNESENFSVYIIDLNLPGIHGKNLIEKIKNYDKDAIIIVQTGNITSENIIHTMKLGVFDYIIKPVDFSLFQSVILKALNYKYLIDQEKQNRKKSDKIIRDQIDWMNYKNSIEFKSQIEQKSLTIDHLITSLSQGAGLGSSVALIDMLNETAQKTENGYLISENIFKLLTENQKFSKLHLKSMTNYLQTISFTPDLCDTTSIEVMEEIELFQQKMMDLLLIKNQNIVLPVNNKEYKLNLDIIQLKLAIQEILVNAMKYSPEHSEISVLTSFKDGFFWISFKNSIIEHPYTGIPEKYEKLVVEPFFRLVKSVDERFAMHENFSIGLGLPSVENIIKKNNGMFVIHEMKDYTSSATQKSVFAEILLPVY